MLKGISPLVSFVLVVSLALVAISVALFVVLPAVERAKESAILNEAMQNIKMISNAVDEIISEGKGSSRVLSIKVTDGEYKFNEKTNSIDFVYLAKSYVIQPGTFLKEDDIILTCGAGATASEYDLDGDGLNELVLDNEVLRVGILKNGTKTEKAFINTSKLIKILIFNEMNVNVTPSDSSIMLDDVPESSYGNGYSELVNYGYNLPKAEALVHVESSYANYDILYTLLSGADFLIIKIQNVYYK